MKKLDLRNKVFGRLTVLSADTNSTNGSRWNCRCSCGKEVSVLRSNLQQGKVKSCGCFRKEMKTKHGMSHTRPFSIWTDMKRRCKNTNQISYPHYGGRGISYDPKWETFDGFWEDMSHGYDDVLTLERIDPNGWYTMLNCKWVLREEQARNKKRYKTNSTGIDGVYLSENKGIETVCAHFTIPGGKRVVKTFSLRKYTMQQALRLAQDWRETLKKLHNYSSFHGTGTER